MTAWDVVEAAVVVAAGAAEVEEEAVDVVDVDVGVGVIVEDGEVPLRHVLSSEIPTIFTSELPPWRPWESTTMNMIDVPFKTSAVQSNVVDPLGGYKKKRSPPGMRP